MYKSILLAGCLLSISFHTFAMPRVLLPAESSVTFIVKEMGVPVSGEFKKFDAAIDIDAAKPEKSSASMQIDIGSLSTGNEEADAVAMGSDWLDKTRAQQAAFRSISIRSLGGGRYEAKARLSIRNKEREVLIQFTSTDQAGEKSIIESAFIIKRSEFGIGGGVWNADGVVADDISVKIRLVLAPPAIRSIPAASR